MKIKNLKCGMCDTAFKKGDTVYEQVETVYQGGDETYPVEVISRWCVDCEVEMQKRVENSWNKIGQKEKVKKKMVLVPYQSVKRIVEHFGQDEQRHFEENCGVFKKHIWLDIKKLEEAMNKKC